MRPRASRGGVWPASMWTAAPLAAEAVGPLAWMAGGEPAPTPTVSFTVPGSVIFPATGALSLFCGRRAMVGGSLARCWVAATIGGVQRVIDIGHGQSTDARDWVASLAGAQRTAVDLGAVTVDAETVATEIVDALALDGITATAEDATGGRWRVTIQNATDLVVPPNVDTTDIDLRGMRGGYRDNWGGGGAGQALNANGGTGGTGSVHVGQQGAEGRVLGVYLWTRTDTVAQETVLAASVGPAYSATPGAMTVLGQAELTIQGFGAAPVDPAGFLGTEELWAQYGSDTATAGIRFRLHGQTPVGRGDLGLNERLVWDTTRTPTDAFGPSYTPTADADFAIYVMIGLIVEHPDGDGNYPANGRWLVAIGDHNPDPGHGTQFGAGPAILTGENTGHRIDVPAWPQMRLVTVDRVMVALGPDEDSRLGLYQYDDLDFPSTTPAALVDDFGPMGIDTVGEHYTFTVPDGGLEVGTDTLSGSRYLALTFNYIRNGGDPLVATLPVFLETAGDGYFGDAWTDERAWHDYVPGASEIAPVSGLPAGIEYRTRSTSGNVGQPVTWGATYPNPMDPTGADSPPALPLDFAIYVIDGIQAD